MVVGVVLLAALMTGLDASRAIPALAESVLWDWLLFVADLAALLMILVVVARVTAAQHRSIWPKFLRYLTLVCVALAFLLIWDRVAHALRFSRLEVSPGMAVCILLAILSLLGAWLHLLGNTSRVENGKLVWPTHPAKRSRRRVPAVPRARGLDRDREQRPLQAPVPRAVLRPSRQPRPDDGPGVSRAGQAGPGAAPEGRSSPSPLVNRMEALRAWYKVACEKQKTQPSQAGRRLLLRGGEPGGVLDGRRPRSAEPGDRLVGFDHGIRMMTGASGGMVGTSYYVSHLYNELTRIPHGDPWIDDFDTNPLPRLAGHIAMEGLPLMLLPRLPWLDLDRGIVLEDQFVWRSTRRPALGMPIQDLRELERQGMIPSLIFSPVIVNDGRRLLISNLDLASMAVNRGDELIERGEGSRTGAGTTPSRRWRRWSSSSSSIRTGPRG